MSINIDPQNKDPRSNRVLAGAVLLVVGIIILIHQLDLILFPWWLFRWPMWVIAFGIYSGVKHNFRNSSWIIILLVGVFFLFNDIFPFAGIAHHFWPLIIIAFGLNMILNRNQTWGGKGRWVNGRYEKNWRVNFNDPATYSAEPTVDYTIPNNDDKDKEPDSKIDMGDDYLDVVSVFSGAKKRILSKDFKGGEIINIFGGADIDLTQADIKGRVIIDVTQVFGGIKLIVPPHWHVTSDMVALFAGFDDKRMMKSDFGSDKILVIKGTSIFAGVDIRSY